MNKFIKSITLTLLVSIPASYGMDPTSLYELPSRRLQLWRAGQRTGPIKEYITKQVITGQMWPLISDDWIRISKSIQEKYDKVNPDFQDVLPPKQR